jgi:autotransporter-associated beta strand protein
MKPRLANLLLASSSIFISLSGLASAASQTWSATPASSVWATAGNWVGAAAPGAIYTTGNTVNADVVTFNSAITTFGGSANPILVDTNRHIGGITFDSVNAGAYVLGGQPLKVSHNGLIQITSAVTTAQTINANIEIRLPSSTNGNYTFRNNATSTSATLTFGNVASNTNSTTRPSTLNLDGSNTGNNIINGALTTSGTLINLVKSGTGTWVLNGSNDLGGNVSATNASTVTINGGTLVVQNNNALSSNATANVLPVAINNTGVLEIGSGTILDNGLSLNLASGGTIRSNGTSITNGRVNLATAAATSATLSTVNASDVFTIGNAANDLTGGASDTVTNIAGSGTVSLAQASNYAGGWSVNAGTLLLGNATALGLTGTSVSFGAASTGKLQLNGNSATVGSLSSNATPGSPLVENGLAGTATLTVGGSAGTTYAGVLQNGTAGVLALSKSGAGTLNLTGDNTYSGATTISGGVLKANNLTGTSATGTSAVSVGTSGTLGGSGFISGAVTVNSTGIIAPGNSVGTLTLGSLTLSAGSILNYEFNTTPANDYVNVTNPGGLTINGGGFNLYDEDTANAFSTIGSYNLIGYSGVIGGSGATSLAVLNPQPGRAYTFGATGSNVTLGIAAAGVISDWNADADGSWNTAGSWTAAIPDGAGATANFNLPLTAARTVTLDGTKTVGGITFHPSSPVGYSIAAGTGGSLVIDNGLSQANMIVTSGGNAISADVSLASSTTVASIAASTSLTLSGSVGGTGSLVKSGSGLLDLTNVSNGYVGNTTISGGTLGFAALGSLGGGSLTIEGGSTLRYSAGNTADVSSKVVTVGVGGAFIDTNGNDVIYANAIGNGGAGGLTKNGSGSLTMQGNNTFTGTTTINGGSVIFTGTSASTGGTTLNGANTLLAISVDGGLGAIPGAATTNLTLNPGAGNSATLRTDAAFTLNANRSISLASGTANIDSNGSNIVIAGNLSGSGLLKKIGAGNLTLSGSNSGTASGGMTIDAGTVFVASQANLPSGTLTLDGTAGITASGAANFSPVVNGSNFVTGTGTVILGLGNLSGAGTLTFGGPFVNDYTGNFTAFTGTLIASGGGSRWNGSTGGSNLSLDLGNTGTSVRNGATGITIGALTGSVTSTITGAGGGATQAVTYTIGGKTVGGLGVTPVDSTFNGSITNGANTTGLTKVGLSTLTLNGTNTYTGATNIAGGTLALTGSGSLASPNIIVGASTTFDVSGVTGGFTLASGQSVSGAGSVTGTMNVTGTLSPGNSPGTLNTGSQVWLDGGDYNWQMLNATGEAGTGYDTIAVTGTLDLSLLSAAQFGLNLWSLSSIGPDVNGNASNFNNLLTQSWTILTTTGGITGFDAADFRINVGANNGTGGFSNPLDAGGSFSLGSTGNSLVLTYAAIPEPGAALLGSLGLLVLLRRRRA